MATTTRSAPHPDRPASCARHGVGQCVRTIDSVHGVPAAATGRLTISPLHRVTAVARAIGGGCRVTIEQGAVIPAKNLTPDRALCLTMSARRCQTAWSTISGCRILCCATALRTLAGVTNATSRLWAVSESSGSLRSTGSRPHQSVSAVQREGFHQRCSTQSIGRTRNRTPQGSRK